MTDNDLSLLKQLTQLTSSSKYDTSYLTHGIHPYPAKYIPQIPNKIISEHTNERNIILDPFCGSGTTLLEASLLGRKSIGFDTNPIATLISKTKSTALTDKELLLLKNFKEKITEKNYELTIKDLVLPNFPNLFHWFQENVSYELSFIKKEIESIESDNLQALLKTVLSSIIVNVSNQESDTRYAAKDKSIANYQTINRYLKKLASVEEQIINLSQLTNVKKNTPKIFNKSCSDATKLELPDNSIDLIVTSPPYPNSYDYYLYHKLRMLWLDYDPKIAQDLEIGSRHEHSSKKADIDIFGKRILPVLESCSRALKPTKLAYFFIGDSIIRNKYFNMGDFLENLATDANLKLVDRIEYSMNKVTRTFIEKKSSSNKNTHEKLQHVIVLESVKKSKFHTLNTNIAQPKSTIEPISLLNDYVKDKEIIALKSDESNRHIHSLGSYPAKFIPEIPQWAINNYSKDGDIIFDPFSGSGTTAVESLISGRNFVGCDISPYACLLGNAKTTIINEKDIILNRNQIIKFIENYQNYRKSKRKKFDRDSFWFNTNHLTEFETIKNFIDKKCNSKLKNFNYAVISTMVKKFSYLDQGQIKVKRDPKKILNGTRSPIELLESAITVSTNKLIDFNNSIKKNELSINIYNTSSFLLDLSNKVDLIVTSPPYINAMNYPMNHRYESLLLDLVPEDSSIQHQTEYIGTERVYAKDYNTLYQFDDSYPFAKELNEKLKNIFEQEPKRSYITYKYFLDMEKSLINFYNSLKPGGKIVFVVGTNTIRGEYIDTFWYLVQIMEKIGFKYIKSFRYEIIKNAFKLTRHDTADKISLDGIAIMEKKE